MPGLSALIAPMTLDEFLDRHYGQRHLISNVQGPLPGWPDLNHALERATIEDRSRFGFSCEGEVDFSVDDIWLRNGSLALQKLRRRIREGHTFIFNNFNLYCDAFIPLENDIRRHFSESVNVNCYVSMRPKIGFGAHWDDHDVFAIQLEGRKYWAIYGFTDTAPIDRDKCAPLPTHTRPIWEGILEKGECLYIPRGCWHSAVSTGAPSLHVACGLNGATGVDILHWLAACAREIPELRVPLRPGPPGHADHAQTAARVCEFLTAQATPDLVARFLKDRDMQAEPPQIAGLPEGLIGSDDDLEGSRVRYFGPKTPGAWAVGGRITCVLGGVEVSFPNTCAHAFEHLAEHGEIDFGGLMAKAPDAAPSDLADMIQALEEAGAAFAVRRPHIAAAAK